MEKTNYIVSVRKNENGSEVMAWKFDTEKEATEQIKEVKSWKGLKECSIIFYSEIVKTKIIATY